MISSITENAPSKSTIHDFNERVAIFFEENAQLIFYVKFSDISLIELVECQASKDSLKEAKKDLSENKIPESLDKVAIAFAQLIDDYEHKKKDRWGRSPFFFGQNMRFLGSFSLDIKRSNRLAEFVDTVKESIEAIQDSIKILSLGLDYRKYARFRLITPVIIRIPGATLKEKYIAQRIEKTETIPEDVEFCIDYVIESALALQEFDFDIKPRKQSSLADMFG